MAPTHQSFEDVSQVINSVLITSKKSQTVGIPLVELDRLYREIEGTTIPYRAVGFACLIDLLEEMQKQNKIGLYKKNDMTMVYLGRVEQAAHVTKLVSAQKDSSRRPVRGGKRFTPRSYPSAKTFNPPVLNSKHLVEVVKFVAENPDGIHKSKMLEYVQDRIDFHFEEKHLTHQLQSINHEVIFKNDYYYPVSNKQSTWESPSPKKATTTTKTSTTDIYDDDYGWDKIQSNTTNTQLPLTNTNAINKLHENIQSMDNKIDENANSTKENGNCGGTDGDAGLLVKQRIKFRLEQLIQNRPDGIWCAELPSLYQREYSIPLNYEDLGFDSVNDFASNLPNIFHCIRPHETGDFKLFYAKELLPDLKPTQKPTKETLASIYSNWENTYGEKDEAVPDALTLSVSHMLIPDGVMEPGESVPQISVTGLFPHEDSSIGVIAVEVHSPTFFWIQLHKNVMSFHSFMTELHEFYTTHASKYVVPIVILSKGLNCAARFDNKWHRGIIKIVHPDNKVTINFYDYGTEVKYPPEKVHYLHRSFSNIPAQAIPCGLFGIKPKTSSHWTEKVTQVLAKAILDVSLYALLGTLDEMNNSMLIVLADTREPDDFFINDWMIEAGHAMRGKMVRIEPENLSEKINKRDKLSDTAGNVRYPEKENAVLITSTPASKESVKPLNFSYSNLIKLRSKSSKNSIEPSVNVNVNKTNVPESSETKTKPYGTKLLLELCRASARRNAALNISASDSSKDNIETLNSSVSSSSASVGLPKAIEKKIENKVNVTRDSVSKNSKFLKLMELSKSSKPQSITSKPQSIYDTFKRDKIVSASPLDSSSLHCKTDNGQHSLEENVVAPKIEPVLKIVEQSIYDTFERDKIVSASPLDSSSLHCKTKPIVRVTGESEYHKSNPFGPNRVLQPIDWTDNGQHSLEENVVAPKIEPVLKIVEQPSKLSSTKQETLASINFHPESTKVEKIEQATRLTPAKLALKNLLAKKKNDLNVETKNEIEIPPNPPVSEPINETVKLPAPRKAMVNIVSKNLPPANLRDFMWTPESNIKSNTGKSETLKMNMKYLNKEQTNNQVRLFIPNDLLALLKDDDETDASDISKDSKSTSTESKSSRAEDNNDDVNSTADKSDIARSNVADKSIAGSNVADKSIAGSNVADKSTEQIFVSEPKNFNVSITQSPVNSSTDESRTTTSREARSNETEESSSIRSMSYELLNLEAQRLITTAETSSEGSFMSPDKANVVNEASCVQSKSNYIEADKLNAEKSRKAIFTDTKEKTNIVYHEYLASDDSTSIDAPETPTKKCMQSDPVKPKSGIFMKFYNYLMSRTDDHESTLDSDDLSFQADNDDSTHSENSPNVADEIIDEKLDTKPDLPKDSPELRKDFSDSHKDSPDSRNDFPDLHKDSPDAKLNTETTEFIPCFDENDEHNYSEWDAPLFD